MRTSLERAQEHDAMWGASGYGWAFWCDCGPDVPPNGQHISYCGQTYREALALVGFMASMSEWVLRWRP